MVLGNNQSLKNEAETPALSGVTVVPCCKDDIPRLVSIGEACLGQSGFGAPYTAQTIEEMLKNPRTLLFAAKHNGRIIGYIGGETIPPEGEIHIVAVASEYRRAGIGTLLVQKSLEALRQQQIESVFLEVAQTNAAAIALYQKAGYKQISIRPKYYGEVSALVMRCDLGVFA